MSDRPDYVNEPIEAEWYDGEIPDEWRCQYVFQYSHKYRGRDVKGRKCGLLAFHDLEENRADSCLFHRGLPAPRWDCPPSRSDDTWLADALRRAVYEHGSYLGEANLSGAELQDTDLEVAQLQGAFLADAKLHGANLWSAELQGANLTRAELQHAFLVWAQLQGALLARADLRGAGLDAARLQCAVLYDARLQGADLTAAQLQGALLTSAQLRART